MGRRLRSFFFRGVLPGEAAAVVAVAVRPAGPPDTDKIDKPRSPGGAPHSPKVHERNSARPRSVRCSSFRGNPNRVPSGAW